MRARTLALSLIVAAMLAASPAALAAGSMTIEGRVELGANGGPLPDAKVVLNKGNLSTGEGQENIDSVTTSADGTFVFDSVDTGDQWQYDVTVDYKGVTYFSDAIDAAAGKTSRATVTVYDTTDSDTRIGVGQYVVYLDADPSGGMAVEQDVTFVNGGDSTFTGKKMAPGAPALTAQLPVASSASQDSIQTDGLFSLYEGGTIGTAYGTTAPIVPGINQTGTLRYVTVPTALNFPVSFPTQTFTLYVAPEIAVTTSGLTAQGQQSLSGGGASPAQVAYTAFSGENLSPGQTIQVQTAAAGGATKVPPAAVFVVGLIIVVALFLLVVRLRTGASFRRKSGKQTRRGPKPGAATAHTSRPARQRPPSKAEHPAPTDDDDDDADLLIAEIAALDESFAQGLIAEDDYQRIRAARKKQLKRTGSGTEEA